MAFPDAPEEHLAQIHGIGPEIARSVRAFFTEAENRALIERLRAVGVVTTEERAAPAPPTLAGKKPVFASILRAGNGLLVDLHGLGYETADRWLRDNFQRIGWESTIDVLDKYM